MNRIIIGIALWVAAGGGCRCCDSSTDYLPPVLDGPYSPGVRRGSATLGLPVPGEASDGETLTLDPQARPEL